MIKELDVIDFKISPQDFCDTFNVYLAKCYAQGDVSNEHFNCFKEKPILWKPYEDVDVCIPEERNMAHWTLRKGCVSNNGYVNFVIDDNIPHSELKLYCPKPLN